MFCEDWDELGTPNDIGTPRPIAGLTLLGKLAFPINEMPSNYQVDPRWFHIPIKDAPYAQLKVAIFYRDTKKRGYDMTTFLESQKVDSLESAVATDSKVLVKSITGGTEFQFPY